jgi:Ca2+-dependent lipid-binding protein
MWNETFKFEGVTDLREHLCIEVQDVDKASSNDFMGEIKIPLRQLYQVGTWVDMLSGLVGKVTGRMTCDTRMLWAG